MGRKQYVDVPRGVSMMTYLVEPDVFDAVEDKAGVVWVEFGRHRGIRPALRMDWG